MIVRVLAVAVLISLAMSPGCMENADTPVNPTSPPFTDGPIIIIRPGALNPTKLVVTTGDGETRQRPTGTSVFENGCRLRRDFLGTADPLNFDFYEGLNTTPSVPARMVLQSATADITIEPTAGGLKWTFVDRDGEFEDCVPTPEPVVTGIVPVEFAGLEATELTNQAGDQGRAIRLKTAGV